MKAFKNLTSPICSFPVRDVDTDMIIPAQYLTSTSRAGYGQHLFARLRQNDPNFFLNQPDAQNSKILIADENFGCGSSREHAVWALMDFGFEVIIAKSFADIFKSNSGKNGLLLISLEAEEVDTLHALSGQPLTIDLETQKIQYGNGTTGSFEYDPFRRDCLLRGLDDLDYLLSHRELIDNYQEQKKSVRFYSTTQANHL
ncbi:MAG: 3-isopropylmalate dehydratase small subunit [Bdellovibrionales bacterium]|nr:3-isopropylmalate dehydratase small subunit [Bdellovibrionales bacterium]